MYAVIATLYKHVLHLASWTYDVNWKPSVICVKLLLVIQCRETRQMEKCASPNCEAQLAMRGYSHDFLPKMKLSNNFLYLYLYNFENVSSNIKQ